MPRKPQDIDFQLERNRKIYPQEWKQIISKYPYEFSPRMIFGQPIHGRRIWQASSEKQIDITNWLIYWIKDGKNILATMDDFLDDNYAKFIIIE